MRKSQSTLEYALLIGVVVGALLGMQNYLKRSIQGRLQQSADQIGEQYSPGLTYRHRETTVTTGTIVETTVPGSRDKDQVVKAYGPASTTTDISTATQSDSEIKKIKPLEEERWPE